MSQSSADSGPTGHVPPPPPPAWVAPQTPPAESTAKPAASKAAPPRVTAPPSATDRWREAPVEVRGERSAKRRRREKRVDAPPELHERKPLVPPWLVSLICHLALLLILALLSLPAGPARGLVLLLNPSGTPEAAFELTKLDESTSELPTDSVAEKPVDVDVPLETIDLTPTVPSGSEPAELPPLSLEPSDEIGALLSGRTGSLKAALLAKYGGTPETENAVHLGLEWLKRNQHSDGGWSLVGPYDDGCYTENRAAATAMAMLAFQGAGHTHRSGDYTDVMQRAVRFLVKQQNRDGFFVRRGIRDHQLYAQAQCTIAICELYAMTRDSDLREPAQKAIDFAAYAQASQGGWRYDIGTDSDLSVTGWFVMGLISGKNAGLLIPDRVLPRVSYFLDSVASPDQAVYRYQPSYPDFTYAMTAEGLLCRQYLGWDRENPALLAGARELSTQRPFNYTNREFYYWYYATQVFHHLGGSEWDEWNRAMRVQLPEAQVKNGREAGSWAPQGAEWQQAGRLYTTCLAIYCLEIYYRHMPLYDGIDFNTNSAAERAIQR